MNEPRALGAIFRRNFKSYFLNPTGYVFICVFVLLSSLAAFWPDEFFTSNMATLDQLNKYFPLIMLIFVPAITMSIWADERRQGTDELLLTIPATDFQVVMGKFLAAVAIYTTALLFSAVCSYTVLFVLGNPDGGLFFCTYLGYWFTGLAMIAIGMVASFLTSNLTVAFVLGAAFNAVPVGLGYTDLVLADAGRGGRGVLDWLLRFLSWIVNGAGGSLRLKNYGIGEQLRDFTQGLVSLSSVCYFVFIVVTMLYIAMVLIGRRHWLGGRDGRSMGTHYFLRTLSMLAVALGVVMLAQRYPQRQDLTSDQLMTLAPKTVNLVREVKQGDRTIHIEAFLSPHPPEAFIQVRRDLVGRIEEIAKQSGNKITYRIIDTEPFTPEAERAEKLDIRGQSKQTVISGKVTSETVFMGVAFSSGLDRIALSFVDLHTPIEYELMRSIVALQGGEKKTLGVFVGGMGTLDREIKRDEFGRTVGEDEAEILKELKLRYNVETIDTEKAVPENIDVLMVVQPSMCRQSQMTNLLEAVERGVPTLIFQDPLVTGAFPTLSSLDQASGMPTPEEPGTEKLWETIGVRYASDKIVTDDYNPMPDRDFELGIVFLGNGSLGKNAKGSVFNEQDPISSKTGDLVFILGGMVEDAHRPGLTFTSLARTSGASGLIGRTQVMFASDPDSLEVEKKPQLTMAARIRGVPDQKAAEKNQSLQGPETAGTPPRNEALSPPAATSPYAVPAASASASAAVVPSASASPSAAAPPPPSKKAELNVVVVCDIDMFSQQFFVLRSQRRSDAESRRLHFDNISFVLNALDDLAGDDRFIEVRKRRPQHRTLTTLEEIQSRSKAQMREKQKKFKEDVAEQVSQEEKRLDAMLEDLKKDHCRDCGEELVFGRDGYEHKDPTKVDHHCTKCDWKGKLPAGTYKCPKCASTRLEEAHVAVPKVPPIDKKNQLEIFSQGRDARLARMRTENEQRQKRNDEELQRTQNDENRATQRNIRSYAVFIPPIFPLAIGIAVFFSRRAGEREGVSKSRLR